MSLYWLLQSTLKYSFYIIWYLRKLLCYYVPQFLLRLSATHSEVLCSLVFGAAGLCPPVLYEKLSSSAV